MDFVFVPRKITKNYSSICETTKRNLYSEFVLNPYPKTKDLQELSEKIHLSKDKIRNWFKYQRKKDFKTKKLIITNYKKNNTFSKEQKTMLENAFRKSSELNKVILQELSQKLHCNEIYIKRWYYYRKKKLQSIIADKSNSSQTQDQQTEIVESIESHNITVEIIPKVEEKKENLESTTACITEENIDRTMTPQKNQMSETPDFVNYMSNLANYYAFFETWYQKQNYAYQLALLQKRSLQFQFFNMTHQV